jgi:hypothetical protein
VGGQRHVCAASAKFRVSPKSNDRRVPLAADDSLATMAGDRNHRVADASTSMSLVPRHGELVSILFAPNTGVLGHVQGIVAWGKYWFVTASAQSDQVRHGWICALDTIEKRYIGRTETPDDGLNHPGGMQVCGDYLFVATQSYGLSGGRGTSSKILIYDLTKFADGKLPTPLAIEVPQFVAGAVGVTDIADPRQSLARGRPSESRAHLIVCHDDGLLRFFITDGKPLGEVTELSLLADALTPYDRSNKSAEHVALFCDANDSIFLLYLIAREEGSSFRDEALLYRVLLGFDEHATGPERDVLGQRLERRVTASLEKVGGDLIHFVTQHGFLKGKVGVHFRYGGGMRVTPQGAIELLASQATFTEGLQFAAGMLIGLPPTPLPFAVNVFAGTIPHPAPTGSSAGHGRIPLPSPRPKKPLE